MTPSLRKRDSAHGFEPAMAWCFAGDPAGPYLGMLRLSVISAHVFHPELPAVCLVPEGSAAELRDRLSRLAAERGVSVTVIPVAVPHADDCMQSRWLKTHLYQVLDADAIALDVDTMLVARLPFEELPCAAVCAAINRDGAGGRPVSSERLIGDRFARCGWKWDAERFRRYSNTGVLVYRRSAAAHDLAQRWIDAWHQFRSVTGEHYDQPAFNHAAFEAGCVGRLPPPWNAPVAALPQSARGALVFHYYASTLAVPAPHTLWGRLLAKDRAGELPSDDQLRVILSRSLPFVSVGASITETFYAGQWRYFAAAVMRDGPTRVADRFRHLFASARNRD